MKKLYQIKSSKIHGKGIFASQDISKNTKIIEYVGNRISKEEGNQIAQKQYEKSKKTGSGSVYVFELGTHDIDGMVSWNPAKYINYSCNPNCKYKIINNRIWIVSLKDIKKGEELSYDYGHDLQDYKLHRCKCKSKNCIGYIIGKRYRKKFAKLIKTKHTHL